MVVVKKKKRTIPVAGKKPRTPTRKKKKSATSSAAASVRKAKSKPRRRGPVPSTGFIGSGSTLMNLAFTSRPDCCYRLGRMVNLIGDSSTGKTFLALSAFAEANLRLDLKTHRFVYDDAEEANSFNMDILFGESCADRIEDGALKENSGTIEEFETNLISSLKKGPCIYILDSFDALDSTMAQKKSDERLAAALKKSTTGKLSKTEEKKIKGSYGMEKAKIAGEILRRIVRLLKQSNSLLIIISQTRVDTSMSFSTRTRSGGKALKFYATHEAWMVPAGKIDKGKGHDGKPIQIGNSASLTLTKNKITGNVRTVVIRLYNEYGVDDIGTCIDYLLLSGKWYKVDAKGKKSQKGQRIKAVGLGVTASMNKLISIVEDKNLEPALQKIVAEEFQRIEDSVKLGRKRKYADAA